MISGATVLAQAIGLAAAPLLTRLFPPDEFGFFFILNSASLTLAAGFALRLEQAIPLPADDDEVRALVVSALGATAALAVVVFASTVAWGDQLAELLGMSGQTRPLLFIAPLTASFALFAVLNALALREARFAAIARRHLILAILTVMLQVSAGVMGAGVVGLCLATVVAQIAGAASMALGSPVLSLGIGSSRVAIRYTLAKFRRFPLVLAPSGWLNSLGAHAPLVMVGALYSAEVAGWFGMTLRVVAVPATFLGTAIANVYVSELARRQRAGLGSEASLFYKVSKNLLIAAFLLAVLLAIFAPTAFDLILGPDWATTGDMARAYAVAAAAQMIASPVSGTLTVHQEVYRQIAWDAARLMGTVGSVWIAWIAGAGPVGAVWLLSLATTLLYAGNWAMCRKSVTQN